MLTTPNRFHLFRSVRSRSRFESGVGGHGVADAQREGRRLGFVLPGVAQSHDYWVKYDRRQLCTQVWSLSSFKVNRQLLTNDMNQVWSVSLLMTSLTDLANEGLSELTQRPSLTWAVSSSSAETTEGPGFFLVKF